ncbi:MAG: arylamine N-acetyltransferase [Solirubrobacteraceae bacterium]
MGSFRLRAYLERIGLTGGPSPSLAQLHRAHVTAIPFENLDPYCGLPVSLEPDALYDKLVARRRGGYCFEQNLLFAAALIRKGDAQAELMLRTIAAAAHPPFVLIDPRAPDSDRWQPVSGTVGEVVARAVEPIKAGEEYYSDMLRLYLGVVTQVLEHAGCWPPSLPFLIDCCQLQRFARIRKLASGDDELARRVGEAGDWIASADGRKAVAGGAVRLQVLIGEAWRPVLAPRVTPSGEHVAVSLANAIRQRAVVLWRTHVDDMPKEAAMISVLALADMYAAAQHADAPWTLLLDEFAAVMHIAADRALAMLQRGRSHHGQVIVRLNTLKPGLSPRPADNPRLNAP